MIASLLFALSASGVSAAQIDTLERLGHVNAFERPSAARNLAGYYTIRDDGKRVFTQGNEGQFVQASWAVGSQKVTNIYASVYYDVKARQPRALSYNSNIPLNGESITLNRYSMLIGLQNGYTPLFWQSGFGDNAFKASSVASSPVSGTAGPNVIFFNREQCNFVALNASRNMVILGKPLISGAKDKLLAFQLGSSFSETKKVALPQELRWFLPYGRVGGIASDWSYAIAPQSLGNKVLELNLKTGVQNRIPDVTSAEIAGYVGTTLFISKKVDLKGTPGLQAGYNHLHTWDRKQKELTSIGPYQLVGSSPNGRFIILRESSLRAPAYDQREFLIDRSSK